MKVVVLAGGSDQIALIKELKKRGHEVLLIDYFQNPPAKYFADKHFVASTLDVEAVEQITISEKADLICTACTDQALLTVAKVSESLSLPCYISYQTALNVTNKSYMKKVLCENNIPTSKYTVLHGYDKEALKGFNYPLVVKPADCNSSKGVKKVLTGEELEISINEAIEYSRTQTAIVEEFKEGDEISADFYVEGTSVKLLCATGSVKIKNRNSFTILRSCYPTVTSFQETQLTNIAQQIVNAFGLHDTPLLIQLIRKEESFNVVEFSARMGGGSKYKLIEVLSGVNIMSKYVDLILGEKPSVCPSKQVNYAMMNYVYCHPGILHQVTGFDELIDSACIHSYFLYKTDGMSITKAETSGDRAAGYLVIADNEEELQKKTAYADAHILVLDEQGNDIMWHGLI